MMKHIPVIIYRGGTSRGVFFYAKDIPGDPRERDAFLLAVMGSPDHHQINGLGGGTPVTSKAVMVYPSHRLNTDVEFLFAQVAVDRSQVEYLGNCGNLSTAVGLFAIEEGIVPPQVPITPVNIFNINTEKDLLAEVYVGENGLNDGGQLILPGLGGEGVRIRMTYFDPGGAVTGNILPTSCPINTLNIDGFGSLTVSFVDVANPFVFIDASDLGCKGNELPEEFLRQSELLGLIERIRQAAASYLGIMDQTLNSEESTLDVPKIALISPPRSHLCVDGKELHADEMDIVVRMVADQKPLFAFAMTGGFCVAGAAAIPGTLVNSMIERVSAHPNRVRIAHPTGVMEVEVKAKKHEGNTIIESVSIERTARRIMDGHVLIGYNHVYAPGLLHITQNNTQ